MLRAVPAMIRQAWSTSRAFRSLNFVSAIFLICSGVITPTFSLPGVFAAEARPSACLIKTAAGGLFVMNSNVRSE